jgi:hypothetical protein
MFRHQSWGTIGWMIIELATIAVPIGVAMTFAFRWLT